MVAVVSVHVRAAAHTMLVIRYVHMQCRHSAFPLGSDVCLSAPRQPLVNYQYTERGESYGVFYGMAS